MLQDHVGFGIDCMNHLFVVFKNRDPACVVISPEGNVVRIGVFLRKSFGHIETVAIDVVFGQPVFHQPFHVGLRVGTLMIEVVSYVIRVGWNGVKPGIVCRRTLVCCIPVELCKRGTAELVVADNVEDHGDSSGVATVDEELEPVFGSVIFIHGKGVIYIITPATVALKFHNGHQFNGIYAKFFKVTDCIGQRRIIVCCNEIPDQQFINHKIGSSRRGKVRMTPVVRCLARFQVSCNPFCFAAWVGQEIRVGCRTDILVVRIAHLVGIWIANADGAVNIVLEDIFHRGYQLVELNPEPLTVGGFIHVVGVIELPVVEVTGHEHMVFAGSEQAQHHGCRTDIIDAVVSAGWQFSHRGRSDHCVGKRISHTAGGIVCFNPDPPLNPVLSEIVCIDRVGDGLAAGRFGQGAVYKYLQGCSRRTYRRYRDGIILFQKQAPAGRKDNIDAHHIGINIHKNITAIGISASFAAVGIAENKRHLQDLFI